MWIQLFNETNIIEDVVCMLLYYRIFWNRYIQTHGTSYVCHDQQGENMTFRSFSHYKNTFVPYLDHGFSCVHSNWIYMQRYGNIENNNAQ